MKQSSLEKLKNYCVNYKIELSDAQIKYFDLYGEYLKDYNNKVNLTAITDDDEMVKKHFLDSLVVSKYVNLNNKNVIDIGSGAGFPGVPLKILNSSLNLTLVDSVGKKIQFLESLKNHINLDYITINKRAEDLGRDLNFRERYDVVIARAVKNLKPLSEYCLPLVKLGGQFVAMKGTKEIDSEICDSVDMINKLGGKLTDDFRYNLVFGDERSLILVKKISQTLAKYPRLTSQILKSDNNKKNKSRK